MPGTAGISQSLWVLAIVCALKSLDALWAPVAAKPVYNTGIDQPEPAAPWTDVVFAIVRQRVERTLDRSSAGTGQGGGSSVSALASKSAPAPPAAAATQPRPGGAKLRLDIGLFRQMLDLHIQRAQVFGLPPDHRDRLAQEVIRVGLAQARGQLGPIREILRGKSFSLSFSPPPRSDRCQLLSFRTRCQSPT